MYPFTFNTSHDGQNTVLWLKVLDFKEQRTVRCLLVFNVHETC